MQVNQQEDIVTNLKAAGFKSAKLLAQVIIIMLSIGNVTLYKIATCLDNNLVKLASKERSLTRLLSKLFNSDAYANFIHSLFKFDKVELVMDRTNWKLGKASINLFVLSFIWNSMAIPLY
jgi:hypothetical protein